MSGNTISLTLKVWRQSGPKERGRMETYNVQDISTDMSFLEMLDVLNEQLTLEGKDPSPSITTAGKASAACAGRWSTVLPTATKRPPRCASFTCGISRTRKPSLSNLFEPRPFPIVKDLVVDSECFR